MRRGCHGPPERRLTARSSSSAHVRDLASAPVPPWRLIVASALMLFVELALIRWTGSNVLHLSYYSNFVLLGSFLGIGLGFLRAEKRPDLFRMAPLTLALLVVFVLIFPIHIDRQGSQIIYFTATE